MQLTPCDETLSLEYITEMEAKHTNTHKKSRDTQKRGITPPVKEWIKYFSEKRLVLLCIHLSLYPAHKHDTGNMGGPTDWICVLWYVNRMTHCPEWRNSLYYLKHTYPQWFMYSSICTNSEKHSPSPNCYIRKRVASEYIKTYSKQSKPTTTYTLYVLTALF